MSEELPVELVCEMLRTAAEVFLLSDRQTVLNIALTGTLGYGAATPILYRTLCVVKDSIENIFRIFDDGQSASSNGSGILRDPPSRRLCPLVRRLFLNHERDLPIEDFKKLANLERILMYHGYLQLKTIEGLPPSFTHVGVLSQTNCYFATPSVTHISYYWDNHHDYKSDSNMESQVLGGLLMRPAAGGVTHIALDICVELVGNVVDDLRRAVQVILARPKTKILALHLLDEAATPHSCKTLLEMMQEAVQSEEMRRRVVLWLDPRSVDDDKEDIRVCVRELILGRDVWTEGRPIETVLEEQRMRMQADLTPK